MLVHAPVHQAIAPSKEFNKLWPSAQKRNTSMQSCSCTTSSSNQTQLSLLQHHSHIIAALPSTHISLLGTDRQCWQFAAQCFGTARFKLTNVCQKHFVPCIAACCGCGTILEGCAQTRRIETDRLDSIKRMAFKMSRLFLCTGLPLLLLPRPRKHNVELI